MAGNDWINSYLEAILDVGPGLVDDAKSSLLLRERGHFSPTRYFVEEVIHVKERGFEFCFKSYHERVRAVNRPCCRLDIPGSTGKVPDTMKCPDCHRGMETFISYKCCHTDGPTAHH